MDFGEQKRCNLCGYPTGHSPECKFLMLEKELNEIKSKAIKDGLLKYDAEGTFEYALADKCLALKIN